MEEGIEIPIIQEKAKKFKTDEGFFTQRKNYLIKLELEHWLSSISIHGIPRLFKAKHKSIKFISLQLLYRFKMTIHICLLFLSVFLHRRATIGAHAR